MRKDEIDYMADSVPAVQRTYGVREIQAILCVSRPTAYKLAHSGIFQAVKVGRHIRISKVSFDKWLDGQQKGETN